MIGNRLLGLRGRPEGLLKLGLMTPPTGVAASAPAGPTISGMTTSSQLDGSHTIAQARDGNPNTFFASTNTDNVPTITIPLTVPAKILWISQKTRADAVPYLCIGKFDWYYSNNASTWTLAQSGCTFPGYTVTALSGGDVLSFTPSDAGAPGWWQMRVTNNFEGTPMPNYVEFAEIAFATDAAGTQLISGV